MTDSVASGRHAYCYRRRKRKTCPQLMADSDRRRIHRISEPPPQLRNREIDSNANAANLSLRAASLRPHRERDVALEASFSLLDYESREGEASRPQGPRAPAPQTRYEATARSGAGRSEPYACMRSPAGGELATVASRRPERRSTKQF